MKLETVNIGKPTDIQWKTKEVDTGIFKLPTEDPVKVHKLGLEGDHIADLSVHGGAYKAVYGYAVEHYAKWSERFPDVEFGPGKVGENLSISGGLFEDAIHVGDKFRIGDVELMAVEPRQPCYKFGAKIGDPMAIVAMREMGLSGVYFKVLKEGTIKAGDAVENYDKKPENITIREMADLLQGMTSDPALFQKAIDTPEISDRKRDWFSKMLDKKS